MNRYSYSLIPLFLFLSACSSYHAVSNKEKYRMMQDYALYKSLIIAFDNDSIFKKDATIGVYFDLASPEIRAAKGYLDDVAEKRVKELRPIEIEDYEGKSAIFKELINMYNNPKNKNILAKGIKKSLLKTVNRQHKVD